MRQAAAGHQTVDNGGSAAATTSATSSVAGGSVSAIAQATGGAAEGSLFVGVGGNGGNAVANSAATSSAQGGVANASAAALAAPGVLAIRVAAQGGAANASAIAMATNGMANATSNASGGAGGQSGEGASGAGGAATAISNATGLTGSATAVATGGLAVTSGSSFDIHGSNGGMATATASSNIASMVQQVRRQQAVPALPRMEMPVPSKLPATEEQLSQAPAQPMEALPFQLRLAATVEISLVFLGLGSLLDSRPATAERQAQRQFRPPSGAVPNRKRDRNRW